MKELYLVNTNVDPSFLNGDFKSSSDQGIYSAHENFIAKVREQHPRFEMPYFALFEGGTFKIPISSDGASIGGSVLSVCGPFERYIEKYIIGENTLWIGETIPITTIVEFSLTELLQFPIERLGGKYNIKKILVK